MKKKLADKDAINKLHVERIGKLQQKNIKLKYENSKVKEDKKKLKVELKQAKTELEEAKNSAVDLVNVNQQAAIEQYKKGLEI